MALNNKQKETARENVYNQIIDFFAEKGEDIARASKGTTDTTVLNMPVVIDGEEAWFVIAVSIPKGTKTDVYDGYAMREAYDFHRQEKELKAKKKAEEKARKIARDNANRAKQKEGEGEGAE